MMISIIKRSVFFVERKQRSKIKLLLIMVTVFMAALFLNAFPVSETGEEYQRNGFRIVKGEQAKNAEIPGDVMFSREWSLEDGGSHVKRYQQYFQGARVIGAQLFFHKDPSGKTTEVSGSHYRNLSPINSIVLSGEDAIEIVGSREGKDGGKFLVELMFHPKYQLFFYQVEKPRSWTYWTYWVDAENGTLLNRYDANPKGWGYGVNGDRKSLNGLSTLIGGKYKLITSDARVFTCDALNTDSIPTVPAEDSNGDDIWDLAGVISPGQPAMVDGQFYARWAYTFFKTQMGFTWESYYPGNMKIVVHYGDQLENATFDRGSKAALFGDGGDHFKEFSGALETVGHELAHGIIMATNDLDLYEESGSLNEAFADIMGTTMEWYYRASLPTGQVFDWTIGEDIGKNGLIKRTMSNPSSFVDIGGVRHVSHYHDLLRGGFDRGYAHANAGIVNHWFYLLVYGDGTQRNYNCNSERQGAGVVGLGNSHMVEVARLVKESFTTLSSNACFCEAREKTISDAAQWLPGEGDRIAAAWNEVGVTNELCHANPTVVIEYPTNGMVVSGALVQFYGWATDLGRIEQVTYKIKPVGGTYSNISLANSGNPGYGVRRTDICPENPTVDKDPDCPDIGFEVVFDSRNYNDGDYVLAAIATDYMGNNTAAVVNIKIRNTGYNYEAVSPSDDCWVDERSTSFVDCNSNFLQVQYQDNIGVSSKKVAYLKFTIPDVTGTRIRGTYFDFTSVSSPALNMYPPENLQFYIAENNNWSQCAINWINQPDDTLQLVGTLDDVGYGIRRINISDYVVPRGPGTYSLCLMTSAGDRPGHLYSSRYPYNSDFVPKLLISRSPMNPVITLKTPNQGENWAKGSIQTISWDAQDITGDIKLVLWKDSTYIGLITSGLPPTSGSYQWEVGKLVGGYSQLGSGFIIRVREDNGICDDSDVPFSISGITVTSPNGGEIWNLGETRTITWSAGGVDNVNILLYENGSYKGIIASGVSASLGTYTWDVGKFGSYETGAGSNYTIRVKDPTSTTSDYSNSAFTIAQPAQCSYVTPPVSIPGTIQAEYYDYGGQGIAYNDTTTGNICDPPRIRLDDVDIQYCYDAGGGYNVGWIDTGEWLEYTIYVSRSAYYDIGVRVAAPGGGSFHIDCGAPNLTGIRAFGSTGGSQTWQTITIPYIYLSAGQKVLRFTADNDYFNLNYIKFSESQQTPYGNQHHIVPGTIQAEEYDNGGQHISYYDTTAGNICYYKAFRFDDVDVENSPLSGAVINVGWIDTGEWLEYTAQVNYSGYYYIKARVAAPTAGSFNMETDTGNVVGTTAISASNLGPQDYTVVTSPVFYLHQGKQVLKFNMLSPLWNVDYWQFIKQ